jgi:hypothetical protein
MNQGGSAEYSQKSNIEPVLIQSNLVNILTLSL